MRLRVTWALLGLLLVGLFGLAWLGATGQGPGGRASVGKASDPPHSGCTADLPVVIDPGHGGIDGGTNRGVLLEKEIVLDIALRTEKHLVQHRIPAVLTRRADVDLGGRNDSGRLRRDLNERIRIANRCRAAFVLSIHVNSAKVESERGMMLFYQPTPWGRDAAFHFDDILRRWPLHERQERPHPRGDFAILHWTKAPAILVEVGFISHPSDRERLADPEYREQIAQALASGSIGLYHQWVDGGKR